MAVPSGTSVTFSVSCIMASPSFLTWPHVRKLSVLASEETIREDDESVDDDESVTTSVDDDTCDV